MIGYLALGTNDLPRAVAFYDKLFAVLGSDRLHQDARTVAWSFGITATAFAVSLPFDGQPASVGNGSVVALSMGSTQEVDTIFRLAISLGAKDEGAPGPRGDGSYTAYLRDLDGNKLALFFQA